ncbi:MAG TPA: Dam family site-specific DNA-(adenine-N6)-methyltransferase [bacterium]|jgi:DNA adenine methylase|nr:Dam family site-specific DNA-(adenine-N6)-methyltransferase [bacterium]
MDLRSKENKTLQPFLKWAGGKRWLLNACPTLFSAKISGRYVEPFLGGAAIYAATAPKKALISDINEELINLYMCIRDYPKEMQKELESLHKKHSSKLYYRYRDVEPDDPFTRAVRTLYLNRTCFNGLYRVNLQGKFNVPIGSKTNVCLPTDNFLAWSELLMKARILACDFEETIGKSRSGDFLFADPPYTIRHNNNGFLKYNEVLFSWNDQVRLASCLIEAASRGVQVVATNAHHKDVVALYNDCFNISVVNRSSLIAANSSNRGRFEEIVITNIQMED